MDIKVKKLYDVANVVVPEELTKWKVTDAQVEEQLKTVAKLSAPVAEADTAAEGDCVTCSCTEGALKGRTVLLYPGLAIPGAEAAEAAVIGLAAGSEFTAELNGEVKLTVEKVLRRAETAVDDALIKAQGIEGVETVDAYCGWYRETQGASNREQAAKEIKNYLLEKMAENSEFDYDKAELEDMLKQKIQQEVEYVKQMTGEQGDPTEEDMAEMMQRGTLVLLETTVEKELCESHGFTFTKDMFEDEIKEMAAEMPDMPGMDEMLDEYRDMYVNQAYMEKAAELLDEQIQNCLEVE